MRDIKSFIDFFHNASLKIRGEKAVITRGKDGNLAKLALKRLSLNQLEQLTLWFLTKKGGLKPTIGAMLSKKVLETLKKDMNRPDFWKEISRIYDKYFPASDLSKELAKKLKPFSYRQIAEIAEETSRIERATRK